MATLIELVRELDQLPPEMTLFAVEPWVAGSAAILVGEYDGVSLDGAEGRFRYVLEVEQANDVVETWSQWRSGSSPSEAEALEAVVYYANEDAYLPVSEEP